MSTICTIARTWSRRSSTSCGDHTIQEDPGILSLQEFELPTEDEWRSRFMLLNFKHKTDPVLRGAPPLRMFDVKSRDGKSLLNLKSFISFFSTSIILIRYGPKGKPKPIQRFNLYHEMAHCSIPGIIIWGKLFGMPFSALVSGLILTGLCPSPFFWWVLGASVVYVAISTSFWLYEGNSGMIEIFADGYAMKRLVEEDLDVAETAGNYWLKLWTKELASGSSRWVELKARISEMKYSLRKIDRGLSAPPKSGNKNHIYQSKYSWMEIFQKPGLRNTVKTSPATSNFPFPPV